MSPLDPGSQLGLCVSPLDPGSQLGLCGSPLDPGPQLGLCVSPLDPGSQLGLQHVGGVFSSHDAQYVEQLCGGRRRLGVPRPPQVQQTLGRRLLGREVVDVPGGGGRRSVVSDLCLPRAE